MKSNEEWSSQLWSQFLQLRKEAWKKVHAILQNRFLTYKHQLSSLVPEAPMPTQPQEPNQISTSVLTGDVPKVPNPVQEPPQIITATPVQAPTQVTAPQALSECYRAGVIL